MYFRILPPSSGYIVIRLNMKIKIFTYIKVKLFSRNINTRFTNGPEKAISNFFKLSKLDLPNLFIIIFRIYLKRYSKAEQA